MGWQGNGTIQRTDGTRTGPDVWDQAATAVEDILSDDHDTHDQDLADAIEKCLNLDGENSPTTDISWGSNKITSLADGTTAGDAVAYDQDGLRLVSTDAGASAGPTLSLYRNSASPAANDVLGEIKFDGEDDGGGAEAYVKLDATLVDASDGSEVGRFSVHAQAGGGSIVEQLRLESNTLTLFDDDAGATSGPQLTLHRDSASPADSDNLGIITFDGENSADEQISYARIFGSAEDVTDGTEDGSLSLQAATAGSPNTTKLKVGATESFFDGINDQTTGTAANVFVNSSTGALARSTSSRRYKQDIRPYERGLTDLLKLTPMRYRGKSKVDAGKEFAGFTAEDVHDAGLTEYVVYDDEGQPDALNYPQMVALLTSAVKELTSRLETLERGPR